MNILLWYFFCFRSSTTWAAIQQSVHIDCTVHYLHPRLTGSPDRLEYDSVEDLTGVSNEPNLWYHSHIHDRLYQTRTNGDPAILSQIKIDLYVIRSILKHFTDPMSSFYVFFARFPGLQCAVPNLLGLWWHRIRCAASDVPWLSHTQGIYLWLHGPSNDIGPL